MPTLNVPWLEFVQIDIGNYIQIDPFGRDLLPQVVVEQLFFGRMKPKAGRQTRLSIHSYVHLLVSFSSFYICQFGLILYGWFLEKKEKLKCF